MLIGAGPVGSLLALFMKKKGFNIDVYEKRPDIRNAKSYEGKSINIALSQRGWSALEKVGLKEKVVKVALPMYGRMIHKEDGTQEFQKYSSDDQAIYSVSRGEINKIIIQEAENQGVNFHFDQHCKRIDLQTNSLYFRNSTNELTRIDQPNVCLAADGAFSVLRNELIKHEGANYSQAFLDYGYKEIRLPADDKSEWKLDKGALHIWPRKSFMLIALPNFDGSFTCTLFLQKEGNVSFENLKSETEVDQFFHKYFADIQPLIPDLINQFFANPTGSLVTIKCFPWSKSNAQTHYALLGDAAHAITPFYGQGMNCGFEDARILAELIDDENASWQEVFTQFQNLRKTNTDTIAQMAFDNFVEMRDGVVDAHFLAKKKLEMEVKKILPLWKNKYELVSFSDVPYQNAENYYRKYNELFETYLLKSIDFEALISQLKQIKI